MQAGGLDGICRVSNGCQHLIRDVRRILLNDAILLATVTMGHAKYPLELFLRVITVSLETMKIVAGLPKLDI